MFLKNNYLGDRGTLAFTTPSHDFVNDYAVHFICVVLVSGLDVANLSSSLILVAGYRASTPDGGHSSPGLMGIDPATGREVWRRTLFAGPTHHNCHILDADGDGIKDCVVVGDSGLMAAIEPRTGEQC